MEIAFLDIAPLGSEIGVRLAPPEYELILGSDHLRRRAEIVREAVVMRQDGGGLGGYVGNPDQDLATARAEVAWRMLRSWDAEHIVAPLLALLPVQDTIVAHPGASVLEYFSFRASLREMIRTGVVDADSLLRLSSLPLWHVRAFDRLLVISTLSSLPLVDPSHTTILLAPPAAEGGFLKRLSRMRLPVARRILEQSTAQLRQIQQIRTLETLLRELAQDAGVEIISPVTRSALLERLSPPGGGGSLILVAHQDERGLHLDDGTLDLCTLRAAFSELTRTGAPTYDNVLLAVCLAEESGNLAVCFQAMGTPIVISHGLMTYYGRVLGFIASALEVLVHRGPRPLPRLVDETWLRLSHTTIRGAKTVS